MKVEMRVFKTDWAGGLDSWDQLLREIRPQRVKQELVLGRLGDSLCHYLSTLEHRNM